MIKIVKGKGVYFVLAVIVVSAIGLRLFSKPGSWVCLDGSWQKQGNTAKPKPSTACAAVKNDDNQQFILEGDKKLEVATSSIETATSTATSTAVIIDALIESPQKETIISSPLVVKGQARGFWFFEASFPVKLLDSQDNIIATSVAMADSDPLTDNFVPYKSLLEFNTTATSGFLVISKDNPSGLPENDASVKIPVLFLNK